MPSPLFLILLGLGCVATVTLVRLGLKLLRKVQAERRHDRAVESTGKNLAALSRTLEKSGLAQCDHCTAPSEHQSLARCQRLLEQLQALQDQYYEEGASVHEWETLARQASELTASLLAGEEAAASDRHFAKLAQFAMQKASSAFQATQVLGPYKVNGRVVDLTAAKQAQQASTACWENRLYQAAWSQARQVPQLIKRAEVLAMLESVEERLQTLGKDLDDTQLGPIHANLIDAWVAFQCDKELTTVWALTEAADSGLAVASAQAGKGKDTNAHKGEDTPAP